MSRSFFANESKLHEQSCFLHSKKDILEIDQYTDACLFEITSHQFPFMFVFDFLHYKNSFGLNYFVSIHNFTNDMANYNVLECITVGNEYNSFMKTLRNSGRFST